ncbi:hypothetical protein [Pyrobaculum calidifontis]|uniref:Uncharacterized protein n=1 Tax=Pyrobaculum calidifontis (strain DSM 21063 / JCM 11548 / VA1) TaxID=410359 RepID=A3MWY8_PYRCJ|nr:hypothetical protein [Pyrobaculum calidifontis]ABO09155.1 conserved hypothetical protein [Pyrobaculum calidifontis JCM 11548]
MDVYTVKVYDNANKFLEDLERQIRELEELTKVAGSELEGIKPQLERYKKLQELLKKFGGGGAERGAPIEVTGLQIYIDPSPIVKSEILEEAYKQMVDLLGVLKKVYEVARTVIEEGELGSLKVVVQFKNGVPVKLAVSG